MALVCSNNNDFVFFYQSTLAFAILQVDCWEKITAKEWGQRAREKCLFHSRAMLCICSIFSFLPLSFSYADDDIIQLSLDTHTNTVVLSKIHIWLVMTAA